MPGVEEDHVWRALADATRRSMLDLLREQPHTTGELCEAFPDLGRTTVMKHLDVLTACRLVVVRRSGRFRWNFLNPVPIQEICERWVQRQVANLATSLLRLKRHAEFIHKKSGDLHDG